MHSASIVRRPASDVPCATTRRASTISVPRSIGCRASPAEIVDCARHEGVHVLGLSILSGGHLPLVTDVVARMRDAGLGDVPVVVGGIIPAEDAGALRAAGVAAVYTPKDFELNRIMADIVGIVEESAA